MRYTAVLFSTLFLFSVVTAQDPVASPSPKDAEEQAAEIVEDPKAEFDAAAGLSDAAARVDALNAFAEKFPESEFVRTAREIITAARAELADEAVRTGDSSKGLGLFRLAVEEAPEPVSDKLFTGILLQIPNNLFFGGFREQALELALAIERKVSGNPKHLLGLATFYIAVENSADATRLAEAAIELDPLLPAAYQTLGLSSRLGFDLEAAERAYGKALELDQASNVSRRSLAEIKRALGKPEEAIALYDEVIASEPSDANAGTGRALALFDAGRLSEAESSLETLLAVNSKNLVLLVGAAYWYAAHSYPDKAIEYANAALTVEPRYTWAYIALGRGLMASGRPLEAERVLLSATRFGNFPTLLYEIAAARFAAGFYREAAQTLQSGFTIDEGQVKTRLGGRIEQGSDNFIDLLSLERKASIFQPVAAGSLKNAEMMKSLLLFSTLVESGEPGDPATEAADRFVNGDDPMKTHRQIFAATRLLERKMALEKVIELVRAAVPGVDESLNVDAPAAAVLADTLYENRVRAVSQGSSLIVPNVPKQTLSRIIRGRIEEIDGWARFEQGNSEEALVHLKRANSIVPRDSAWSRSTQWKMGIVLESLDRPREALDSYISSYRSGDPDKGRLAVIEKLYESLEGSLDGLKERLEAKEKPADTASLFVKEPDRPVVLKAAAESEPATGERESAPPQDPDKGAGVEASPPAETPQTEESPIPEADNTSGRQERELPPPPGVETQTVATSEVSQVLLEDIEHANREAMDDLDLSSPLVPRNAGPDPEPAAAIDEDAEPSKPASENEDRSAASPDDRVASAGDTPPVSSPENKPGDASLSRPRIVSGTGNPPSPAPAEAEPVACRVVLDQDAVSLAADGGNIGVLAGIEGREGVFRLKALSSSPSDVAVSVDPGGAGEIAGRALFVVRSISSATGVFTVTFESSCGTRELQVTVR